MGLYLFDLVRGVLEISHRPTKQRFTTERPGTSSEKLQCAYSELYADAVVAEAGSTS
jgi:hypothetical protein